MSAALQIARRAERRWVSSTVEFTTVVYTYRGGATRLISARRANVTETRVYGKV
jgi:uncharacterized DUF497 family protein